MIPMYSGLASKNFRSFININVCVKILNLSQMEGFQEFEARRRKKFDKQIDSNVMISSKGLDEGVDL